MSHLLTHQPLSILLASAKETPKFLFVNIGLIPNERTWLHERIVQRFKVMLKQGLIEETVQRPVMGSFIRDIVCFVLFDEALCRVSGHWRAYVCDLMDIGLFLWQPPHTLQ